MKRTILHSRLELIYDEHTFSRQRPVNHAPEERLTQRCDPPLPNTLTHALWIVGSHTVAPYLLLGYLQAL